MGHVKLADVLDDIQGNILRGYGFPRAAYLFFEVHDAAAGRGFLGDLVDRLQAATLWTDPPATATNVAFTYAGLQALGVSHTILDALSPAFREPIRKRAARLLDDTGPSAPEGWDDGLGTERSHVLVTVNGSTPEPETPEKDAFIGQIDWVLQAAAVHGLALVHRQDAAELWKRREHFGWADGLGQPDIEGTPWPTPPGGGVPGGKDEPLWRPVKPGEFIHGCVDEDGYVTSGPAAPLLRHGTYMVYRKLYQDVVRFRKQLQEDALLYGASLSGSPLRERHLYELMAAKVVGRWRDGHAIEVCPVRSAEDAVNLGDEAAPNPSNDFRYLLGDGDGFVCPKGAHIRRTNPRDALGWDGKISFRHRIIRRGMPYGEFLRSPEEKQEEQQDDGRDRGLIFVCFNASLERQFEVVQRQWCNDGNAFRLGNDKDYLLGDTGITGQTQAVVRVPAADGRVSTGRVTIEGKPPHFVQAKPPVVVTKGCEYLLMPGIGAVRDLAAGLMSATDGTTPGKTGSAARR